MIVLRYTLTQKGLLPCESSPFFRYRNNFLLLAGENIGQGINKELQIRLGDVQCRQKPERRFVAQTADETALEEFVPGGAGSIEKLDAYEKTTAAHSLDFVRHGLLQGAELVQKIGPEGTGSFGEMVAEHDFDDLGGNGCDERSAAEGGSVAPGGEALGHFLRSQDAAHGQAVGESLGHADDVRPDAVSLESPEFTGAAHAGLHFIADEQNAAFMAQFFHAAHVVIIKRKHAGFALDAFHHDSAGLVVDCSLQGVEVIGRYLLEASGHGSETIHKIGPSCGGQGAKRASVETARQGNDIRRVAAGYLSGIAAGELDGRLVSLGSGVAEKGLGKMCGGNQQLGKLNLRFLIEEVADVPELAGLLGQRADNFVIAVAEAAHGDTGEKVNVFFAVAVPET